MTHDFFRLKPHGQKELQGLVAGAYTRPEKLRQFLEGAERPCPGFKIHILEVGYCNDWNWETKLAEKREAYRCLVARMKKCGWKVVYKQVALGTRGGKGGEVRAEAAAVTGGGSTRRRWGWQGQRRRQTGQCE